MDLDDTILSRMATYEFDALSMCRRPLPPQKVRLCILSLCVNLTWAGEYCEARLDGQTAILISTENPLRAC
jgi:hypothetical protein